MSGFITDLSDAVVQAIRASAWASVDFETTALSPSSPATRVGSGQKIGGEYTATAYQKHFGQGLDCRPRARVWSVMLEDGSKHAFDLDRLSRDEISALLRASLDGKIVVGHNLGFDFGWALTYTDFAPALVVDTMLLIRCMRPGVPWRINRLAVNPEATAARTIVETKTEATASLQALCIAYGLPLLDKEYQKPHNWCVRHLSPGHLDYCLGDIDAPVEIVKLASGLGPSASLLDAVESLKREDANGVYFELYQRAPLALARMHRNGLPLDTTTLQAIRADRQARVRRLLPELYKHIPEMREHAERLEANKLAVSAEMKKVLGAYAEANGCKLDESEDGTPIIQRKKAALKGATELAGWKVWDELQRSKKILSLCTEYEDYSLPAAPGMRRLHPLIGANTVTLRCNSQAPNSQNLLRPDPNPLDGLDPTTPLRFEGASLWIGSVELTADVFRDCVTVADAAERWDELQFRAVVKPGEGMKVVSVDQAQVELRIAAALGQRAIAEARQALAGEFTAPGWVLEALRRGDDLAIELDEKAEGFDGFRDQLAATWRRVQQFGAPLAEVFRRGLDPHLLTGLAMAAREGVIDLGGKTPVEYLSDPSTDAKALKKRIASHRQNAKPANFGLLYGAQADTLWRLGVTDYGLDWTPDEASAVRDLWLEQYADVRFWQLWVQLVHCAPKGDAVDLYRRNRYSKELEITSHRIRTSLTLGGRPIYTPEIREVLNHQDQSTGAEITTRAIVDMPEPARSYLCNAVHDELIAIAPAEEAELVASQIKAAFRAAMDRVLAPWGIPSDADSSITDYWTKD